MIKLSVVCCVLFFGGLTIADNVPALIWGSSELHYTLATALKQYTESEFIGILIERISTETFVLVIAEPQLSTEDLSQCRTSIGNTCFQGIQQLQSKLYLPAVQDPVSVIEGIAGLDTINLNLLPNGKLSESLNRDEGGKFVFISIPDGATEETKESKFARHDQLISKLTADLAAQNIEYVIIFTGKRAEQQKRVVRQAPATSSTTSATTSATSANTTATITTSTTVRPKQLPTQGILWKRGRLLMYYLGLQQVAADGTATDIPVETVTVGPINEGALRTFRVEMGTSFAFNVSGESGYWWVHGFTWNDQAILSNTRIAAVDTFSFHCSPSIEIGTLNRATLIRWTGLQIQADFGVAEPTVFDSFGDSWDCVGFVSPGIVGGLFVVIMLLFILSIGISWMMDINTMDRFDDPKGKTITISVNE